MYVGSFFELFRSEFIKKESFGIDLRVRLFVSLSFEDENVIGVLFEFREILFKVGVVEVDA